jgi:acetyl esterase/lipase
VSQLSFFTAESVPPAVADLSGVLAASGQIVMVGGRDSAGARLSVVVDQAWRASALAEMIHEAGLEPEIARTEEDTPLVRTAVSELLRPIAAEWTRGAVKTVPPRWLPGPRELRAWTLAAGTPEADRYLLGLDPHAPDTHSTLASALMRVGIAPTLIGTRGGRPALRISGRRRLSRLVENVGEPPADPEALSLWPRV